jgi:hypothetical protein
MLTRCRYHLVRQLARENAYCLAILYFKYSEYSRQDPLPQPLWRPRRAVIQEFAFLRITARVAVFAPFANQYTTGTVSKAFRGARDEEQITSERKQNRGPV